ncbi:SAV_2336 N-terminal domain-related protein [Streptomyces sp. BA2]|uniref:SAV_2336 N-terminal domain-related protein n=1 Tax=Streptomyces sp. BA2 TaxID=436595 RepID=UPI0013229A84|nr:SAV_2336 N-terminal domain-related protein [Streptomyces sp. BA2]MWA10956.1 HAD hydrolase-like protein [Streptomyces sp. BA2]
MHSDAPRHRGPVARLADLLAEAADGSRPTSIELAELLWLARQMDGDAPERQEATAVVPPTESTPPPVSPSPTGAEEPAEAAPAPAPDDRVPLRLPAPAGGDVPATPATPEGPSSATDSPGMAGHTPVRVPVPPMVTHPLTLQRALRPLKRRVPSPVGQVIDEEATAHRIARLGGHPRGWLPVLRPADERWLRLCLVYDAGPTMPIWRPLVHELHTALAQSGIFRTVELHRAEPDGTVPPQAAHAPASGRTVTLVISDCMGPQWRDGAAGTRWYRTLRRWAEQLPVAVIQPLPERLWRTTALPTTPGSLSATHPAAPSAALAFTPYAASEAPPAGAVPIPVLEPAGAWLSHWAALVADAGGARLPGAVGWLGHGPPPPDLDAEAPGSTDITDLTPEDLVLRFRSTASPEAFRLAGHLAVGEPQLPVMRLVQAAVEERPRPQHLAEVILSGMLSSGGAAGAYQFRDGVRELLLRTLPRTARGRTRELLARVGGLIDERAGVAPGVLRAVASSPGGGAAPAGEPFATVTPESVRQLGGASSLVGGRYRLVRATGRFSAWLAQDTRQGGQTVLVQRYPQPAQWLRLSFEGRARELSRFRHANVAAVLDFGVEDDVPYLVSEFVDGHSLRNRLSRSPYGLPPDQLLALIPPLAGAVRALHAAGLPHGAISTSSVIVTARGPVLTGLEVSSPEHSSTKFDLRALSRVVGAMCGGLKHQVAQQLPLALDGLALPEHIEQRLQHSLRDLASEEPERRHLGIGQLINLTTEPPRQDRSYSLLGPLQVTQYGHPLEIDSPEEQALLCMLLLQRGRNVPYGELTEGIWGPSAPERAEGDLRACAHRLANTLAPETLIADDDGYTLPLPSGPDRVDLFHCQRLAADAQGAYFAGDFTRTRELVRAALGLWRGTPLIDVPGPAALATRVAIAELRQTLLRMWDDLNRQQGTAVLDDPELSALLQEFPYTEDEVMAPQEELPSDQLDDLGVHRETEADQPVAPPTSITFEYLARPAGRQEDVRQNLGREISHLLIRGGIGPDLFEMRAGPRGWEVVVAPEVHVLHVLTTTVTELPAALDVFPVLGLGVTLTHEPDPTVSAPAFPSGLRHLLGRDSRRAVVIVSSDLHERLNRSGRLQHRFQAVPQSDDWYCEVTTEPPPAPVPATIESVLLGFDGTLAQLYTEKSARHAARALTALIADRRDPEAALAGIPLLSEPGPAGGTADRIHPMDVLRAFARRRTLSQELHTRLEEIEMQAALTAKPSPHVANLLHTLARPAETLRLAIVTDTSPRAVTAYLGAKGLHLPGAGIHGRTQDLTLLMPDPDCPRRALEQLGTPADRCVMVGSSPEEAAAARSLRIAFIGYAPGRTARERLAAAGVRTTVSDLSRLVDLLHDR